MKRKRAGKFRKPNGIRTAMYYAWLFLDELNGRRQNLRWGVGVTVVMVTLCVLLGAAIYQEGTAVSAGEARSAAWTIQSKSEISANGLASNSERFSPTFFDLSRPQTELMPNETGRVSETGGSSDASKNRGDVEYATAVIDGGGISPSAQGIQGIQVEYVTAVTRADARVRMGPGETYPLARVDMLPTGTNVYVIGRNGAWALVAYRKNKKQVGWVDSATLTAVTSWEAVPETGVASAASQSQRWHDYYDYYAATTETAVKLRTGAGAGYGERQIELPPEADILIWGKSPDGIWLLVGDELSALGWVEANNVKPGEHLNWEMIPATTAVIEAGKSAVVDVFETGGQTHDVQSNIGRMKEMGMVWVKVQYKMHGDSQARDVVDLIERVHSQGMKILLGIPGQPYPESVDYEQYIKLVSDIASLPDPPDAIEIWNEMNIDAEWPAGEINPTVYVTRLLAPAYEAIKSQNPSIIVISGAPAPTGFDNGTNAWSDIRYINGMAGAGAESYADCIGVHYNAGATSPHARTGHPAGEYWGWYFLPSLEAYHRTFNSTPLCITEMGYLSADGWDRWHKRLPDRFWWAAGTSVQEQGQWTKEAIGLARSLGYVRMLIVFNIDINYWESDPQGGYSLIRPDGTCPACELGGLIVDTDSLRP